MLLAAKLSTATSKTLLLRKYHCCDNNFVKFSFVVTVITDTSRFHKTIKMFCMMAIKSASCWLDFLRYMYYIDELEIFYPVPIVQIFKHTSNSQIFQGSSRIGK